MSKTQLALLSALIIVAVAAWVALRQRNQVIALQAELAAGRAQAADATRLRAENDRLNLLEEEVRRLRDEAKELPRLRGDVARLRRDLTAASNQVARIRNSRPPSSAGTDVSETNGTTFTGSARASLAPGQTLVMGGWPMEPGKRTLALFTPDTAAAGQQGAVVIGGMFLQVPDAVLSGPGWEQFQAVTKDASSSGVFEAEQARKFVEALQKIEGVDILSSPRLATTSGTAGRISIWEANGSGLTTTLLPVVGADDRTVDLTVSNALRQLPSTATVGQ